MAGSVEGASALVPGAGPITDDSTPNVAQVSGWLQEATTIINAKLSNAGYDINVTLDTEISLVLDGLANLYTAATVLQARGIDSGSGLTEDKSEKMFKRFYTRLDELVQGDLTELGAIVVVTNANRHRRLGTIATVRADVTHRAGGWPRG